MDISKRLQMIAKCVPVNTNTVVDVGTDHAYIPIYLIRSGLAKHCIASDINPKPLSIAINNIDFYKMSSHIETRLGSGLSKISVSEADVIIIAGMGGMLMIDILKDDIEVVKDTGLLILQPQLDIDVLRRYLHSIDFTIIDEKMICEDGKYYTIIVAKPGKESPYLEKEYLFGKKLIENKNLVLKEFLIHKINHLDLLIDNLENNNAKQRLEEVEKERQVYKEVLKCLYR